MAVSNLRFRLGAWGALIQTVADGGYRLRAVSPIYALYITASTMNVA